MKNIDETEMLKIIDKEIRDDLLKGQIGLTKEQEIELFERIKHNDMEAKKIILEANTLLISSIAKKYYGTSLVKSDLIQEGIIGLLDAIDKFDIKKGVKFSTYAIWRIRKNISRAVAEQDKMIRLPLDVQTAFRKIVQLENAAILANCTISDEEIKEKTGISTCYIKALKYHREELVSLETEVELEDETYLLKDDVCDYNCDVYEEVMQRIDYDILKQDTKAILEQLNEREQYVVRMHYGFETGTPVTFKEIGEILGISRQRASEISEKAMEKMRRSPYRRQMYKYL